MANVPLLCSEYLYCPVCLDLFREPVTIPCGHTFCLTCITQCWSLQGMPASCPQCRSCFQQESSPRLCKNSILSQMVDDFSKLQGATERMAVGNIPARSVGIPLKMNLLQDVSEENIGSEASIGFAIPSSGEVQESSSTQISGARKIVGQGLADIVRVLQASGLRLLKMMDQAECQILKNTESRELEALYISVPQSAQVVPDQLQDQLQEVPLEEQDTQWNGLYAAVTNFKECLQEMCADHMGRLVQQVWCTQSSYPVSPPKLWGFPLQPLIPRIRAEFLQYLREVTLDPETAHHNLCLTQGNHRVLCKLQPQAYSDHPGRFDHYTQVLGRESMGHGRHYWEVHLSGNRVSLGVTYHNISRKGHHSYCLAGRNSKSWCLEWSSSRCYAWHDGQRILVATGLQEKLGIFLDWDEGSLSFHEVSDDMPLLHQFNTSFIQLVYPIFYVSWNSIMSIGEAMPTHQSDHNKRFYRQMSAEF